MDPYTFYPFIQKLADLEYFIEEDGKDLKLEGSLPISPLLFEAIGLRPEFEGALLYCQTIKSIESIATFSQVKARLTATPLRVNFFGRKKALPELNGLILLLDGMLEKAKNNRLHFSKKNQS